MAAARHADPSAPPPPPAGEVNQWGYTHGEYAAALAELEAALRPQLPDLPQYRGDFVERFLRARKLDVAKAREMALRSAEWRRAHGADGVLSGAPPDPRIVRYFPHHIGARSRAGNPVYYERTGHVHLHLCMPSALDARVLSWEAMTHWKVWTQERAAELGRERPDLPNRAVGVLDMTGLSISKATKPVMDFYQFMGACDEANYPETMEKVILVNAGTVFTTLWKVAKHFFAEEIRQKIELFGASGWQERLNELIDPDQLPPFLGGTGFAGEAWAGDMAPLADLPSHPAQEGLAHRLQVAAGKQLRYEVVAVAGAQLTWAFCTEVHNIKFSVIAPDGTVAVAESKVECCNSVSRGSLVCAEAGTYVLVFDNTYSWKNGKTLRLSASAALPADGGGT